MCSFLVNDTILPSDNPLCFRKILSEQIYNKTITIDYQIKDEKQQFDINREAAKMSALSSGKTNRYEYLTGDKMLPYHQKQITEQVKLIYSPLGKNFKKQKKSIEDKKKQTSRSNSKSRKCQNNQKYIHNDKDNPLVSKQKEIVNKLADDRLEEITGID